MTKPDRPRAWAQPKHSVETEMSYRERFSPGWYRVPDSMRDWRQQRRARQYVMLPAGPTLIGVPWGLPIWRDSALLAIHAASSSISRQASSNAASYSACSSASRSSRDPGRGGSSSGS